MPHKYNADRRDFGAEMREWADFALSRNGQATRRETGMPRPVMMLMTLQATLASVFCVGRVRAWRPRPITFLYRNPDKGFSGCGFELIAGLKVALGLERVDLVGGNSRHNVNEGIDDGSMLRQIEGRELLDMADDGLGHVPGIEQGFIV